MLTCVESYAKPNNYSCLGTVNFINPSLYFVHASLDTEDHEEKYGGHVGESFLNPSFTPIMTHMQNQKQPFEGKQIKGCIEINGVYEIRRAQVRGVRHSVYRIEESKWTGYKFLKFVYPEVRVDEKKEVWIWKLEPGQYLVVERVEKSKKRYDLYVWHLTVEPNKACWQFWSKTWVSDILDAKPMLQLILEKRLGGSS